MNIPPELLSPELLRKIADTNEAAEEIKPEIMATYRRLVKYGGVKPGHEKRVFSLVALAMLAIYIKGKARGRAEGDEQPPESQKAALARRRETGGHWG